MDGSFDVGIDPYRLDEEWVRQPQFYWEYARKLADARCVADEAKNLLEVTKADIYQQIAANPDHYGLAKTTEAALSSAVPLQPEVQRATRELNEARHAVAILEAAVSAIDQRKKALERLVELHLADYFSKPKVRGESRDSIGEFEKSAIRKRGRIRKEIEE